MITTRDIKVDLSRERRPLNQKTTKEVDVYVKKGEPKPSKIVVTTHNVGDFEKETDKKKKDKIIAQKKVDKKKEEESDKIDLDVKEDEKKKLAMQERMARARAAKGKKSERNG